jgi:hypothetical protein
MLDDELDVSVVNINDSENLPKTVDELRLYDQVILVNVAYKNMPDGFDEMLYSYVYEIGGGLFTICGNEQNTGDEWIANAYTREDMYGTTYQKLLPVDIINYTPPVGVVIIIDNSGSMLDKGSVSDNYSGSKFDFAKHGAFACLDALTERDYVGIITLGDGCVLELTPRPNRNKIDAAIASIAPGKSSLFAPALEIAGNMLSAKTGIEKRHIILVTDGEPADTNPEYYQYEAKKNAERGITMSIVGVQTSGSAQQELTDLLVNYAGMIRKNFHMVTNLNALPT